MIEFYKKRDFGEIIGDTFQFFKTYGKNFFKNYLLINGGILLLLLVVVVIGYGDLIQQFIGSNQQGQKYFFEQYFQENQGVFIAVTVLVVILFLLLSLINFSFPVLYMKRLSTFEKKEIALNDLLQDLKENTKKLIVFFLGMLFIITPLFLVTFSVVILLMLIVIGFFIMLIVLPAMMNIINFAMFHYYYTDKGFFEALGYGFQAQFSKSFWKYIGVTLVVYLIIQVVSSVFTMIPMFMMLGSGMFVPSNGADLSSQSPVFVAIFFIFYMVAILVSFVMSNIIYVNAGFMYYDNRTDLHQLKAFEEIDSIGKNEV